MRWQDMFKAIVVALTLACLPACSSAPRDHDLQITWLANEGVLLAVGAQQVLIDALIPAPYSIYTSLPASVAQRLLAGEPPFAAIELALVSHIHRDHNQPGFAEQYLAAHPSTRLISSPQVVASLHAKNTQSLANWPRVGESQRLEHAGIEVEFMNLSHGIEGMQNLGHIIGLGPFRILHLGDAEPDPANFSAYAFAARQFDVALIPYWYYSSAAGRDLIATHIQARLFIAVHIPRAGEDDDNLDAARTAGASVPTESMQRWTLDPR